MKNFCLKIGHAWVGINTTGHPIEIGHTFQENILPNLLSAFNTEQQNTTGDMPRLSALVCTSAYDLALHDAYGMLHNIDTYDTYNADFMNADLSHYLDPADDINYNFSGHYPENYLIRPRPNRLPAWHAVGGNDLLDDSERTGDEPDDGYPVVLPDWIQRDGITCLKIKLTGQEPDGITTASSASDKSASNTTPCGCVQTSTAPFNKSITSTTSWTASSPTTRASIK